jgi:hypothetical protein
MGYIGYLCNLIEFLKTNCSNNYIYCNAVVIKMPLREDDNTMFITNMIYERQIKRVIQCFYLASRLGYGQAY